LNAIYNDPYYGLGQDPTTITADNVSYLHWNTFSLLGSDSFTVNRKLAWGVELEYYFGLTAEQVSSMSLRWQSLYNTVYNNLKA